MKRVRREDEAAGPINSRGLALFRALVADVDGTLLNREHGLSISNETALRAAVCKGVRIILATGRQGPSIGWLAARLQLAAPQIVAGGAMVMDAKLERVLYKRCIPAALACDLLLRLRGWGLTVLVARDGIVASQGSEKDIDYFVGFGNSRPTHAGSLCDFVCREPTNITVVSADDVGVLEAVEKHVNAEYGAAMQAVRSAPGFLDIVHKKVSKGSALRFVLRESGIQPSEVVAIGDAQNDLSLFEVAGYRVAMGNSCSELAAKADMITSDCDHDGVAEALRKLGSGASPMADR